MAYFSGTYSSASQLAGLTPLSAAPVQAGVYTVVASFAGSTDYSSATALANFTITQAIPTVSVTDAGGTYSGTAFAATDSVTGVSGSAVASLEGVTCRWLTTAGPTRASPSSPASRRCPLAARPGRPLHGPGQLRRQHRLHERHGAGQLHHCSGDTDGERVRRGGIYNGTPFVATDCRRRDRRLLPAPASRGSARHWPTTAGPTPARRSLPGLTPLSLAPCQAGPYTVVASFAGSTDYSSATELANFTISQATPQVDLGPSRVDRLRHAARSGPARRLGQRAGKLHL